MAKKYSYWISSGKYSMMQKMCIVLSGVLSFMLLARLFVPAKFGIWGLFMTITSIIETLRHALIKNGYILFINTSEEEERPGIEYAATFTNIVFSGFLVIFFLFTASAFEDVLNAPGLAIILQFYCISLLALIPYTQREFYLMARMDFKRIFYMYFIRYGLFLLLVVLSFLLKWQLELSMLSLIYGITIIAGVSVSFLSREKGQKLEIKYDKKIFRKFLHYGKFVLGTNFSAMVFKNTDSFMTSRFIGPIALSFYNSSTRIINFAEMPTQVLGDVMFPRATQIVKSGVTTEVKNIYEKTVAASLTLIAPFVVMVNLFPEEIILLLAGKQYLDAAPILRVLVLYALFLPFVNQFGNIIDALGRPKWNFAMMAVFAVVNIVLNFFLIAKFHLMGPAYAILLSYVLLFIATQTVLHRVLRVSIIGVIKNVYILYGEYWKIAMNTYKKIIKKDAMQ